MTNLDNSIEEACGRPNVGSVKVVDALASCHEHLKGASKPTRSVTT